MKYASIVKQIRTKCKLSQSQLAEKLSVSFATVNRWEREKHEPSMRQRRKIRDFCLDNKIDIERFKL